ncbi:hypothetical protein C4F51_02395 [Cellvibrio sp. KB43]|uniref:Uncharacterized protein n=1 Tax=Cellvibrio polysaccharolyticus TaxID=2082724 RepID=A0A928V3N0_9GAMM|nr:hypothetical protein [Cellvibrio polysaccharolyticus]
MEFPPDRVVFLKFRVKGFRETEWVADPSKSKMRHRRAEKEHQQKFMGNIYDQFKLYYAFLGGIQKIAALKTKISMSI